MDSTGFTALADELATDHTVVTYDPRGIAHSTREDTDHDITPDIMADDLARLLSALGTEPAYVFGSSGGAVTGLALVTRRPGQVRTLVAHEPPVGELLPDGDQLRARIAELREVFGTEGPAVAMKAFFELAGLEPPQMPPGPPDPAAQQAAMANMGTFFNHMISGISGYRPDLGALRNTSARVVVAAGAASEGQLAHRTAVALAERLGQSVVTFPGGHAGFMENPKAFAAVLGEVTSVDG